MLQSIGKDRNYTQSGFLSRRDGIKWKISHRKLGGPVEKVLAFHLRNWSSIGVGNTFFLRKGVWFVLNLSWTICHVGGPANCVCHKSAWQCLTLRLNLLLLVFVLGAGEQEGLMPWLFLDSRFNLVFFYFFPLFFLLLGSFFISFLQSFVICSQF